MSAGSVSLTLKNPDYCLENLGVYFRGSRLNNALGFAVARQLTQLFFLKTVFCKENMHLLCKEEVKLCFSQF